MDRITAIHESLTVFVCGIFGLLPVLGCVPAVYAVFCSQRVKRQFGREWNPADAYLRWGTTMALLGLLSSAVLVTAAIIILVLQVLN